MGEIRKHGVIFNGSQVIDSSLNTSSDNPVKNKAIATAINAEQNARTSADALLVPKTTKVNGHELNSDVTVSKSDVGLGNVDNTSDANKPISTATQTALNTKYEKPSTGIPKTDLASAVQTSLGLADTAVQKATTVNGHALSSNVTVTKSDVGLGNVDNTSDSNKPVSTAQQAAIDAKYTKPSAGIPKTDLASAVQTSLEKADTAV